MTETKTTPDLAEALRGVSPTEAALNFLLARIEDVGERAYARWAVAFDGDTIEEAHEDWPRKSNKERRAWRSLAFAHRAEVLSEAIAEAERIAIEHRRKREGGTQTQEFDSREDRQARGRIEGAQGVAEALRALARKEG